MPERTGSGNPVTIKAEGLMACCLQQEIDHLNGKLILDYASLLQRLKIKKTLAKIKSGEIKESSEKSKMRQSSLIKRLNTDYTD